ncbi:MAG: hypothetical protein AAFN92_07785 [Bacteroidota bacterium]
MNPVRAIYLSCACLILLGLILSWATYQPYSALIIFPLLVAAGTYTLSPQIMWWHWKRNPPDLDVSLASLLERFDLYRRLDLAGKREFRRRTFLLREATSIEGKAIEEFPPDVKVMVAASAATVGFHREEFLLGDFEKVIFYRHFFPSPEHEVLHSSELYPADGAIIWTLNVFLRSCIEPQKYLHLGLYEYGRALLHLEPSLRSGLEETMLDYARVEKITGFSEEKLKEFIGLEELDLAAITLVLYHTHQERLEALELTVKEKVEELLLRS